MAKQVPFCLTTFLVLVKIGTLTPFCVFFSTRLDTFFYVKGNLADMFSALRIQSMFPPWYVGERFGLNSPRKQKSLLQHTVFFKSRTFIISQQNCLIDR